MVAVRGLIRFLLLLGVLAVAFVLALPWILGFFLNAALGSAGFSAGNSNVSVQGWGGDLVRGSAPGIELRANDARFAGATIGELDLTLGQVGLLERTFERVDGTATDVTAEWDGESVHIDTVTVAGPSDDAVVSARVAAQEVTGLIERAIRRETGLNIAATLTDGAVELSAAGIAASGQLVVERGALFLESSIVRVRLVDANTTELLRLTDVSTDQRGLTVECRADVASAVETAGVLR